ncbi:MAG: CRISPR-associated RAMP protein, partial [Desulfobacterales bacterium]|nr:CRISPR-associated RAMP protein [Desulfobacterales bacterium]
MNKYNTLTKKVRITGDLTFETAFHIGSGKEGELATNMGVLREADGRAILPGSTVKGSFRSFAERLSSHLGLSACLLDASLSGVNCVGDEAYRRKVYDSFKKLKDETKKLDWVAEHTCDVCKLFGSPVHASRAFFSDGKLRPNGGDSVQVRDGVCIDRDTETARYGAKYDFEVVPRGAVFSIVIDLENPGGNDLALIAAVIAEWEYGFRLGGFTSRGLGRVRLTETNVTQVDYKDPEQLKAYLINREMSEA